MQQTMFGVRAGSPTANAYWRSMILIRVMIVANGMDILVSSLEFLSWPTLCVTSTSHGLSVAVGAAGLVSSVSTSVEVAL